MSRKTPAATKKLRGNPSGKKPPKVVVEGVGDLWSPPPWFKAAHRAKWIEVLENAPRGLLSATDRELVTHWCVAAVNYADAFRKMNATGGMVIETDYGPRQNPYLTILNKQAEYMLSLSKHLGFNPASRATLGAIGAAYGAAGQVEGSVISFLDTKPPSLAA